MSQGSDAMRDVYAKLKWAETHLAEMMSLARGYLRPGGGDDRPIGIAFDNRWPPIVVAKFIVEEPLPIEISLHAGDPDRCGRRDPPETDDAGPGVERGLST